ncbi:hypothetical protein SUH3_00060 [Pseudosulfitobacter pseudonitzschiae]|uniref:Uncharacterized protein n=1 Tax=Pseudosulfitobacter pseudonitzschiae TaxID=1402135 RepID=A0A073JI66_9RHOB|nr:hypothetical protein [Pseudosulfitobacter pseudonitzschiae]KEJ97412.1 hypothetical protein SUH3_00060 [Pseudosulfitobacter pseudonitzschiae]QKS08703.1 hypothetical protein HT745_09550 [Pseudosulfitobacter pseudonitzschiae]
MQMLFRKLCGAKAVLKAHDQVFYDAAWKIIGLLCFNLFKSINQRVEINDLSVEQDAQNRFVKLQIKQDNIFNVFYAFFTRVACALQLILRLLVVHIFIWRGQFQNGVFKYREINSLFLSMVARVDRHGGVASPSCHSLCVVSGWVSTSCAGEIAGQHFSRWAI